MSYLTSAGSGYQPMWSVTEEEYVNQLAFSADGNHLATACADGSVAVYSWPEGKRLWREEVHGLGASALAWSHDNVTLATGGQDSRIIIWSGVTGAKKHTLTGGRGWVEKLAWSSQHTLAGITGKELKLWNSDGLLVSDFAAAESTLTGVEWQDDGSLLTSAYGQVARWYPTKRQPVKTYEWKGSLLSLAVRPDGAIIAAGSQEGAIHLWRLKKGNEFQMGGYDAKVRLIAWSRNGRYFYTAGGAALVIWDCKGKGPEGTRPDYQLCHDGNITALAAHPQQTVVASGAEDGSLFIYDSSRQNALAAAQGDAAVSCIAWHPVEPVLAAGTVDGGIHLLKIAM